MTTLMMDTIPQVLPRAVTYLFDKLSIMLSTMQQLAERQNNCFSNNAVPRAMSCLQPHSNALGTILITCGARRPSLQLLSTWHKACSWLNCWLSAPSMCRCERCTKSRCSQYRTDESTSRALMSWCGALAACNWWQHTLELRLQLTVMRGISGILCQSILNGSACVTVQCVDGRAQQACD